MNLHPVQIFICLVTIGEETLLGGEKDKEVALVQKVTSKADEVANESKIVSTHLATHCWSTSSLFRVALTMEYVATTICDE